MKHGFVDRIPVSQNETNTARQSLYGFFKHKSGLQTLSALFGSVVRERRARSKISSSSAFKPPPRVTLTEAKRKTWLNDLADPLVPLRKLSRTIPQGIKGQTLLDQCFSNRVPIGRALWFAKCVGANEIRTLKRKGTSAAFATAAEIKWLRDWTTNVEQFLECSIDHCGQADWRPRMTYALGLAVRLYSEFLLDRDHYLDWIVKSLSSTSLDFSPTWLLLVHLHKTDLLKYRKWGRLLAGSLLELLRITAEHSQRARAPLTVKLKEIVRSVVQANPAYLVMPQSWRKYKTVLEDCLDLNIASDLLLFKQISFRNERLCTASCLDSTGPRTPRQLFIDILDSASSPFNVRQIAEDCRSASDDMQLLVDVVLEWSSSRFRAGEYRVFLAVRLLEMYHDELDITSAVIDFLASPQTQSASDPLCLRILIAELVRSHVFVLSRYLQSLIARGGLPQTRSWTRSYAPSAHTEDAVARSRPWTGVEPCQVLTAVPLHSLTPLARNLRGILLERAGFSSSDESKSIESCKGYIATQLPRIVHHESNPSAGPSAPDFAQLSWSMISEIAQFLKQNIQSFRTSNGEPVVKDGNQAVPGLSITDAEFRVIRSICEELGNLSVLADILKLCTTSDDEKLLASITDTVNFHLDAFSALGAFEDLHESLFRTYLSMRTSGGLPRQFTISLISLGSVISSSLISVTSLQQDLAGGDRNLAVAACSPVSDGMAESLQQAGQTFTEEFEAVLSTGNRMEEQTMTQLFNVLAERLEKGVYQNEPENDEILCALHARLRIYRRAQFDTLIAAWLERLCTTTGSRVKPLLPILISTGCVSFETCVDVFLKVLHANEKSGDEGLAMRTHLASFLAMVSAAEKRIDPVSYKLKLGNARHIKDYPDRALQLRTQFGPGNDESSVHLSNDLVIHHVLKGQACALLPGNCPPGLITSVLDSLLQLPNGDSKSAFPDLLKRTTDLSMPFCRFRLQMWVAVMPLPAIAAGDESVAETLFDLAKSERDSAWTCYATVVGLEIACQVREKAEEAFFAVPIYPGPVRNQSKGLPVASGIEQASNYLKVVSRTAYSIPSSGVQAIVPMLVDRLSVVLRGLLSGSVPASNNNSKQTMNQSAPSDEESTAGNLGHLTAYLTLLLQMTAIHRTALVLSRSEALSSPVASQKQSQQDVVKILMLLTNLALHPSFSGFPEFVTHIFDVLATIVDDVAEDVRVLCARILKDKMRDQRVDHLFGSANNIKGKGSADAASQTCWATDGLQMVKDDRRVGEYRCRHWEMLEGGVEASISLSLFDAQKEV